jgi:hypothetical protein
MIFSVAIVFVTILIETFLYITKAYKCDLITQRAKREHETAEKRKYDRYYELLKKEKAKESQEPKDTPKDREEDGTIRFEPVNEEGLKNRREANNRRVTLEKISHKKDK